jgi:hypothetical protein
MGEKGMTIDLILMLFIEMLFCHILDDYYLQGILASLKQRKWWEENYPEERYKNDYKIVLIEHGFSWSFVTSIPILINGVVDMKKGTIILMVILIIINTTIHSIVDDLKCNKLKINLITDQMVHIIQLISTMLIYIIWIGL